MNANLTKKVDSLLKSDYLFNKLDYTLAKRVGAYLYKEIHQENTTKRRAALDYFMTLKSEEYKEVVDIATGILLALEFDIN